MKSIRLSVCVLSAFVAISGFSGCPLAGPAPGDTHTFDGIDFVWIPAGTFTMGSPDSEDGRFGGETQHVVTISHGFWLGKYKVTQAQWDAVMETDPSNFVGPNRPVDQVTWNDTQYFVAALNAKKTSVGGPYRLPTESEWEYAYRAGTTTRFYWGEDSNETAIGNYAWYSSNSSASTQNVGEKLPNAWGLFDMAGDLNEWCQDWYGTYPAGPVTDPKGPASDSGAGAIVRGGSWSYDAAGCRAASRHAFPVDFSDWNDGVRLARNTD